MLTSAVHSTHIDWDFRKNEKLSFFPVRDLWENVLMSVRKYIRLLVAFTVSMRRSKALHYVPNLDCKDKDDGLKGIHAYSIVLWISPENEHPQVFTFSAWASSDFKLLVTFFSSSSRSPDLLNKVRKDKTGRNGDWKGSWSKDQDNIVNIVIYAVIHTREKQYPEYWYDKMNHDLAKWQKIYHLIVVP